MRIEPCRILDARAKGLEALQAAHWREVAVDKDKIPLSVDWNRYVATEEAGAFMAFAMSDGDALVGYNAFFTNRHFHYSTTVFAVNDVIYVRPENRGLDGIRFILSAEKELAGLGVRKILYHSKEHVFFAGATRGSGAIDSLDNLDRLMELEEEFRVEFPHGFGAEDLTFGGLLKMIGYTKEETTWGKLLKAGD